MSFIDELGDLCEKHHLSMSQVGAFIIEFSSAEYKPGDEVVIEGHDTFLVSRMNDTPGGWVVNPSVDGFRCWNEDSMRRKI